MEHNHLPERDEPTPSTKHYYNFRPAITNQQKATAFNKQLVNIIQHKTKATNRQIDIQSFKQ